MLNNSLNKLENKKLISNKNKHIWIIQKKGLNPKINLNPKEQIPFNKIHDNLNKNKLNYNKILLSKKINKEIKNQSNKNMPYYLNNKWNKKSYQRNKKQKNRNNWILKKNKNMNNI